MSDIFTSSLAEKFKSIFRNLDIAFRNIFVQKYISFSTIFILVFVLVLFHFSFSMRFMAHKIFTELNSKVDIVVELNKDVKPHLSLPLIEDLQALDGVSADFIPKEDSLETFLESHPKIQVFLAKYKLSNPIPDLIEIRSSNLDSLDAALVILEDLKYRSIISTTTENLTRDKNRSQQIITVLTFFERVSNLLSTIFVIVLALVIFNTININIHHRKKEIKLKHQLGSDIMQIQTPFMVESIMILMFSFLISAVIDLLIFFRISALFKTTEVSINLFSVFNEFLQEYLFSFPVYLAIEVFVVMIITLVTSYLTTMLYIKRSLR